MKFQQWSSKIKKNTNKTNRKIQTRCFSQGLARLKLRCWTELRFILRLRSFPNSTIVGRIWFCMVIALRTPLSCWLLADGASWLLEAILYPATWPSLSPTWQLVVSISASESSLFPVSFFQEGPSQDNLPSD